ncbi:MAG: DUF2147 domain-containing protein [Gammaproteobacteria bacterium]
MRINKTLLATIGTLLVGSVTSALAATITQDALTASPIGYWKTIDETSGKPKSIVKVWKTDKQVLMAKVVKLFPAQHKVAQNKICSACSGAQHNKPIVGMVIISGLKSYENQWKSGEILDPENGKTYNCSARLSENGKKLNVKEFVGFPLFGRSQTWERVDLMSG